MLLVEGYNLCDTQVAKDLFQVEAMDVVNNWIICCGAVKCPASWRIVTGVNKGEEGNLWSVYAEHPCVCKLIHVFDQLPDTQFNYVRSFHIFKGFSWWQQGISIWPCSRHGKYVLLVVQVGLYNQPVVSRCQPPWRPFPLCHNYSKPWWNLVSDHQRSENVQRCMGVVLCFLRNLLSSSLEYLLLMVMVSTQATVFVWTT